MSEKVLLIKIDKPAGGPQHLSFSEPIGLCYIAAYLKLHGVDCKVAHLIRDNAERDLLDILKSYAPTTVGFSVRNFNFKISVNYAHLVRQVLPRARLIIGGECITETNAADLLRDSGCDLAVISDGEEATLQYVRGTPPATIPGVAFRDAHGDCLLSDAAPVRVIPSELPMMDRSDLPMEMYQTEAFPGKPYATMHTQRGCRYRCTFCHTACRYKGPHNAPLSRTHQQITDEIDHLTNERDIETLAIWDEDFFADIDRVEQLAESLIVMGSPVEWHTYMKLTDLKNKKLQRILPVLQQSNYVRAVIGFESFIPETLRQYHKAGGPDVEESLERLSDAGIRVCPSYIIGEPHERFKRIEYGLEHLLVLRERGIKMDFPYVSFITPFPGTPLYDQYSRNGLIIDKDWDHYDGEHVVVRPTCEPEQLVALRDSFYREFYDGADK